MRVLLLTIVLFLISFVVIGQRAPEPITHDMGGKIDFTTITDSGILVVSGNGGLSGIKPDANKPHFFFTDYGTVKKEALEFIPMTPYVIVTRGAGTKGFLGTKSIFGPNERSVIDVVSGKRIFDTKENGWASVSQLRMFVSEKSLVVVGKIREKTAERLAVGIYDLETGEERSKVFLDGKPGQKSYSNIAESTGAPYLKGNELYVPTNKYLACVNVQKGDFHWTLPVKEITSIEVGESGEEIYGFKAREKNTLIYKFSKNGKDLWEKEQKVKGSITRFQILPQGIAVVSDAEGGSTKLAGVNVAKKGESKINFFDGQTGKDLWEKAPKTKGYVQHFYILDNGVLFGLQEGGVNFVSFDGTPLFKKPLKTGEDISTLAETDQGIIYISSTDANVINIKTGESIWDKPIKYKKARNVSSAFDKDHNRYLLSTGKEVMAIDSKTGDVNTFATISFEGKEEPDNIEIRDNGILFTSSQNMLLLDFNGNELWKTYYSAPGVGAVGSIFAGVVAVGSMAMTASMAMEASKQNSMGNYNKANNDLRLASEFENIAMKSFSEMAKRFKATSATQNSQFILTKLDDGVGLVKINKDTGEKELEVLLKDKNPEYTVDERGGVLYYQSQSQFLDAFDLK